MHGCIFSVITSGVICVKVVLCSPSHSDDHVGTHAHATAPYTFDNCTRSGSPHNVLHSSSYYNCEQSETTSEFTVVDFAGSRTLSVYYSGYRTSKLKVLARACHKLRSPNAQHSSGNMLLAETV